VAEARKLALVYNDTTSYQKMLREYLQRCPDATKNVYTQFCVEVGLQDKVQDSLQRWINVTLGACSDRPDYSRLKRTLTKSFKDHGGTKANVRTKVAKLVAHSPPNILAYDDEELRDLLRAYTHEDEVINNRARELCDEHGAYTVVETRLERNLTFNMIIRYPSLGTKLMQPWRDSWTLSCSPTTTRCFSK
jgi:hypothetical protein